MPNASALASLVLRRATKATAIADIGMRFMAAFLDLSVQTKDGSGPLVAL